MPLSTQLIGACTAPITHHADSRWLMAYAAGLNDLNPAYMDTHHHPIIGHPVFPVCLEWPVILDTRTLPGSQMLTEAESARGVHAAHDLHIFRPIQAGEVLTTQACMIEIRRIKPGASYTLRLDTRDENNLLVAQTYQLGIYRNVDVYGDDCAMEPSPELPMFTDPTAEQPTDIFIPAGSAHTYTECARIWNPIHTDRKFALQAGLPDIILHGTATLALAISHIIDNVADGDPTKVVRLGGRFSAMVLMPSTIKIRMAVSANTVSYQVTTQDGLLAISQGFVCLRDSVQETVEPTPRPR